MSEVKKKKWFGPAPTKCDLCPSPITIEFIDGRIEHRTTWANMCPSCFAIVGAGLGTGFGQRYRKEGEEWLKVEG